jgi:hypothetical protein
MEAYPILAYACESTFPQDLCVVVVVPAVRWKGFVNEGLRAIAIVFVTGADCQQCGTIAVFERETTVWSIVLVGCRGLEKHCRMCCGCQRCCHSRSSPHSQLQEAPPPAGHLSMPAVWDAECISDSSEHTECTETSCHTSSSSLHNYYRRWACGRRTWVLFLVAGDPLRYSGCGRVRYNVVAKDPWKLR